MGEPTHPPQELSLPPARGEARGLAEARIGLVIAVGVTSFFTGVIGTLAIYISARSRPVVVATTASPPPDIPPTSAEPSASSTAAPPSSGAPSSGGPEDAARRALTRLKEGIGACVRDVIGVMPGTSPAVPSSLKLMKNGVYTSLSSDFRSPVFSCAHYRETEPQSFQIQWQRGATPVDGAGIAWLDDNGDGQADRAFGFRARLVRKNEVTLGDIEAQDPMPKVLPVR